MRKLIALALALIGVIGLVACGSKSGKDFDQTETCSFCARVLEVRDDCLLVEPLDDTNESKSADKIQVSLKSKTASWDIPTVDNIIKIVYDGSIMESYPAQLREVYHIEILSNS